MRFGIRAKQVAGVTAVVALAEVALFASIVVSGTRFQLENLKSRASFLSQAVYQRSFAVVAQPGDPVAGIANDGGIHSILESAAYIEQVEYAVVVDPQGRILAAALATDIGTVLSPRSSLDDLIQREGAVSQIRAIFTPGGRTFEISLPLAVGTQELGSIRVGVSTLLIQDDLKKQLGRPAQIAALVLGASVLVAMFLAGVVLRPIHVIRSGLARLGRGELDVNVDLPADAELRELGDSFRQVTARLAADQTELAGQRALESVVDRLEDAVALFAPDGALLFANAAMEQSIGERTAGNGEADAPPQLSTIWSEGHPYRTSVERALKGTGAAAPAPIRVPDEGERLVMARIVPGAAGAPLGVLLVSRNLAYLSQVESTIEYSRKLAKLNGLTAGIAHEIKNPLNATMIHLELLKMQVADRPEAEQHVSVIADQVRRLDQVLQDIMKFLRPEVLHLEPVGLPDVFEHLRPVLEAEAAKHAVDLRLELPADLPAVEGDANLLEQAFLNLALNAFQAMPGGGRLRIGARAVRDRLVSIDVEDSGIGIAPENLPRIFDLYFTTKPSGSGIGLSLVFRTVQLHGGDIEVRSTPGHGARFRIQLKQATPVFENVAG